MANFLNQAAESGESPNGPTSTPVNEPKRHHINPQVLLREFAGERGRVRVVPKYGGSPRLQHISNVSVIRHANTMQTDTGRDNSLERLLAHIEDHFPAALSLLDLPQRTPEQDALVLSLVVTQAARDPNTRAGFFGGEIEPIYAALRHALREHDPSITETELNAEIDHYGRTHVVKSHLSPTPENVAVAGTAWLIMKMYEDLAPYRLTVVRSPRSAYITADSPVSIFPGSVLEHDEASFLPDTEFLLPVTPKHAVLITAQHAVPQRVDADLSIEAVINARTAKAALREVYCAPDYELSSVATALDGWWASMPLIRLLLDAGHWSKLL